MAQTRSLMKPPCCGDEDPTHSELSQPRRFDASPLWMEMATFELIHWFNHRRLHSAIGDVPPMEFEAAYYCRRDTVLARQSNRQSLYETRGGIIPRGLTT
jgi:transposase InsO family protein